MQTAALDTSLIRAQATATQSAQSIGNLKMAKTMNPAKVERVAAEFESQFLGQIMENMFSTVDTNGFLDGGDAEETYRSMMINEYGKLMSKAGGIGIAAHVKQEMLRMQEV